MQPPNPLQIQLENKVYRLSQPMTIGKSGTVLDGHGATLQGNGSGTALQIGALGNVTVKNLKITGFAKGIQIDGAKGLTLTNISIVNCGIGLRSDKADTTSLGGSQLHGCETAALLNECTKFTLEKSDLSRNKTRGLSLQSSMSCLIRDNKISFIDDTSGKSIGISIEGASNNNQILRNSVVRCNGVGISSGLESGTSSAPNTIQSNDTSWSKSDGIAVKNQAGVKLIDNCSSHCDIGIHLMGASNAIVRGNLIVGCIKAGIFEENGLKNSFESNIFAMDSGASAAMSFKALKDVATGDRLFQNTFIDYQKPLKIENAGPMTLQSNTFVGANSLAIEDLAEISGIKPLAFDNQEARTHSNPFITSIGTLAALPSLFDHVCGVSVSSTIKPDSEIVVEGSLTGAFQGEQEVFAQYKGVLPMEITFPPRTALFVRIQGVSQTPAAFLTLLGDQSLAKNHQAEDSADSILKPDEAVDGDTTSPDHGWQPPTGKAGDWWQVDLKAEQNLTAVTIVPSLLDKNGFWEKFHVQVSTSGAFRGEEVTVVTETNWSQRPGTKRIYRFAPTKGRYIRVIGDVDQAGVRLVQFGAYGLSG